MNEPAIALFTSLHSGVKSYTRYITSDIRDIVGAEKLTVEQHQAIEEIVKSKLESLVWYILGRFDNVGCSLPDTVLGYHIVAMPCIPSETGDPYELPEVDIAEDEQDYAAMWRDYLARIIEP